MRDVAVRFGRLDALAGLDLALSAGEVTLLAGPNGAGKSTLIRVLLGLVRPDRGQVVVDGAPVRVDSALKARLGYLPEAVAFSDALTGREVMAFFARARGVAKARIAQTLDRVGLSHAADRVVRDYSRGMRQRLGLGVAILASPEILVLDEPSGGLDQDGLVLLWSVLDEWRAARRVVLLASHEIALLESRVDRVCLLSAGRRVAHGTPAELRKRAALPLRVHLELASEASAERDVLAASIGDLAGALVVRDRAAELELEIPSTGLIPLLQLGARHGAVLRDLRVKEPPFDEVYRRLLERPREPEAEAARAVGAP